MLEVKQLKRTYGDFVAADAVTFSIAKGEIVGLLGHNGAGKTTVMKMLSGYLEPSAGQVVMDGLSLSENLKSLQQKIGYLPENLPVYPEMSVAEYLDYAAELKGLRDLHKQREVKRVILATDIAPKLLAPIATLSRGYKQRVGVAQALLGKPQLLILDEPTNGLDPHQTQQMRELIRAVARDATVILSTHIMQEVDALCDRVLMMRAGQLVIDAKLAELRQSHAILLGTNLEKTAVEAALKGCEGLGKVETLPSKHAYHLVRIALQENTDPVSRCGAISKLMLGVNADIFQLQMETRDLETLFREVNAADVSGQGTKAADVNGQGAKARSVKAKGVENHAA